MSPPAPSPEGPDRPDWRVLVMCTANMCRSPMAAALLARDLTAAGVGAEVSSCGLLPSGAAAAPEVVKAMAERGLDLSGHRSRRLAADLVQGSDLILAMAREHLREVVVLVPSAFGRTFTLKELVRRGRRVGPRPAALPLAAWLDQVGGDRRPQDLLGSGTDDDVADPIGGPYREFQATAAELEALSGELAALLAGRG